MRYPLRYATGLDGIFHKESNDAGKQHERRFERKKNEISNPATNLADSAKIGDLNPPASSPISSCD
ncbi:hypothetical protein M569_15652 [Genlisea aurea]|uniref:Uncharacterized protein n=1 Tax=Genlisea aurea TaxID=192259 RepID=S8D8W5_9LAMI|nr:hypothetical protein M569_15652 [Genlisea aurea]